MWYVTHVAGVPRPHPPWKTAALSAAILMYWKFAIFSSDKKKNSQKTPQKKIGWEKGTLFI